jgi:hypothetical protein
LSRTNTARRLARCVTAAWLCAAALIAAPAPAQAQLFGFSFGSGELPDAARFGTRMEMGDVAAARDWLAAGLSPDFVADRIGTGLMIAASIGNIPLMEVFIARGADPNKTNTADETALMHAAWRGKLEAVKWLLAHGARLNREPLKWTALHYAVFAGHQDVAAYLLERGADINARSTNGSTVLMMAAFEGHEKLAQQLLAKGADTSLKNENGDGALEWAFKYKRPGIARIVADKKTYDEAAALPQSYWGEVMRSVTPAEGRSLQALATQAAAAGTPPPPQVQQLQEQQQRRPQALDLQIEHLESVRATLAARGLIGPVERLDKRIVELRAAQARARAQELRTAGTPAASAAETSQIDAMLSLRATLAARGMSEAVDKLDRRIASLRAKRAKPDIDAPDDAVLRITATRPARAKP